MRLDSMTMTPLAEAHAREVRVCCKATGKKAGATRRCGTVVLPALSEVGSQGRAHASLLRAVRAQGPGVLIHIPSPSTSHQPIIIFQGPPNAFIQKQPIHPTQFTRAPPALTRPARPSEIRFSASLRSPGPRPTECEAAPPCACFPKDPHTHARALGAAFPIADPQGGARGPYI